MTQRICECGQLAMPKTGARGPSPKYCEECKAAKGIRPRAYSRENYLRQPRVPCSICDGPTGWTLRHAEGKARDIAQVVCRPCRLSRHGSGGYARGCRCAECRGDYLAKKRKRQAQRRDAGLREWAGYTLECKHCKREFVRPKRRKYCSLECYGLAIRKPRSTELVHMGPKVIEAPPVAVTIVTMPKWWAVLTSGPCAWCGDHFIGVGTQAAYCSNACQRNAMHAKRGGKFVIEPRIRQAIYERDDFTCQLCREPVDLDADPRSDWYPSLDHIVPQSHMLIPDHSPANLRTAHRWCNAIRGDGTRHADFFKEAS